MVFVVLFLVGCGVVVVVLVGVRFGVWVGGVWGVGVFVCVCVCLFVPVFFVFAGFFCGVVVCLFVVLCSFEVYLFLFQCIR
ncbi:hypothetical protein NP570_23975, partial [Vibrio parahaemolyticus]|nr:hypothetical protein [Vibrio parahaemolyticus]